MPSDTYTYVNPRTKIKVSMSLFIFHPIFWTFCQNFQIIGPIHITWINIHMRLNRRHLKSTTYHHLHQIICQKLPKYVTVFISLNCTGLQKPPTLNSSGMDFIGKTNRGVYVHIFFWEIKKHHIKWNLFVISGCIC